jgi:hypothetical protein
MAKLPAQGVASESDSSLEEDGSSGSEDAHSAMNSNSAGTGSTATTIITKQEFKRALRRLKVPAPSCREGADPGAPPPLYTPKEDKYMLAVQRVFHAAGKPPAECKAYLADRLNRTRSGIDVHLRTLLEDRAAAGSDVLSSSDLTGSACFRSVSDTDSTSTGSTVVLSKQEFKRNLSQLKLPDTSDRPSNGYSFLYTPEENQYILSVQRIFQAAGKSPVALRRYLAGKIGRSRSGISAHLRSLLRAKDMSDKESISGDRNSDEQSSVVRSRESGNDTDSGLPSLSDVLSAHLQQPRTSHHSIHDDTHRRLGKRKWEAADSRLSSRAEDRKDVIRQAPAAQYNAGSFTPEEDAIIWVVHTQHRTETTSSSAAAGGAGGRDGVLGYVSELAELLGRSYTQVQRRLDCMRAQDQATPR